LTQRTRQEVAAAEAETTICIRKAQEEAAVATSNPKPSGTGTITSISGGSRKSIRESIIGSIEPKMC